MKLGVKIALLLLILQIPSRSQNVASRADTEIVLQAIGKINGLKHGFLGKKDNEELLGPNELLGHTSFTTYESIIVVGENIEAASVIALRKVQRGKENSDYVYQALIYKDSLNAPIVVDVLDKGKVATIDALLKLEGDLVENAKIGVQEANFNSVEKSKFSSIFIFHRGTNSMYMGVIHQPKLGTKSEKYFSAIVKLFGV